MEGHSGPQESKDLTPPLSPPPVSPRALSWPHPSLPPRTLDHVGKAESGAVRADGRHSARTSSVHAGIFSYRHRGDKGEPPTAGEREFCLSGIQLSSAHRPTSPLSSPSRWIDPVFNWIPLWLPVMAPRLDFSWILRVLVV